ncbi:MAG: von Willebrand factor type A domain-containing protein [Bacteroidota bacterium]
MRTQTHIRFFQTFMVWMLFAFGAMAQSGTIKGTVTDEKTKDPIPFANLLIESGGKAYGTAVTDFDGNYTIKPLPAGKYDLKAQILGYKPTIIKGVEINADKITFCNIQMTQTAVNLNAFEVREYKVPLISKDQTTSGETISMSGNHYASSASYQSTSSNYTTTKSNNANLAQPLSKASIYYTDPNTESYDKIKESEFEKVNQKPLSTFSIDVDVASYGNMRRFLSQGLKPPPDAIRTEELINYFDYKYPAPVNDDAFAIYSEVATCPWNPKHQLVHIGIQGKTIESEDLPKCNLVFLLDVSGSMADENKLTLVKKSMRLLVNQLQEFDKIAIVTFSSTTHVELNSTSCKNKDKILNVIEQLHAEGSTSGEEGIKLAYEIAKKNFIENGNNRVIIATDGDFNVGLSSDADIENLIIEKRKDGIFLSVLGFGMGNYKDSKMEKLADKGNGNYAYIDNLMEAKKVLVKEMGATLYNIAKDVKIQVEFNPLNVKGYRLIGYEDRLLSDKDFNDDRKDAGELGAGSKVTALYEIITSENEMKAISSIDSLKYQINKILSNEATLNELMTVKVRYKKPDETKSELCQKIVSNNYTEYKLASENFKFSAAVAAFSMLLRDSKFIGKTSYSDVIKLSKQGRGADDEGYRSEFIKLVEMAELIK